jgi:hypothetical protein
MVKIHAPIIWRDGMEKEKKPYEKPELTKHEEMKNVKGQNRPPTASPSF